MDKSEPTSALEISATTCYVTLAWTCGLHVAQSFTQLQGEGSTQTMRSPATLLPATPGTVQRPAGGQLSMRLSARLTGGTSRNQ